MNNNAHKDCSHISSSSVCQSLEELEFERGIWCAALDGDIEKVERLLSKGINPSCSDSSGYTALHYAARNGRKNVCCLLLKRGAKPNMQTPGGATPLHRAAFQGHAEIVSLLLAYNADPFLCDSDGKTALHKAAEQQHFAVAEILIRYDPSIKLLQDNKGLCAIDYVKKENSKLRNLLQ